MEYEAVTAHLPIIFKVTLMNDMLYLLTVKQKSYVNGNTHAANNKDMLLLLSLKKFKT